MIVSEPCNSGSSLYVRHLLSRILLLANGAISRRSQACHQGCFDELAEARCEGLSEVLAIHSLSEGRLCEGLSEARSEGLSEARCEDLSEGRPCQGLSEARCDDLSEVLAIHSLSECRPCQAGSITTCCDVSSTIENRSQTQRAAETLRLKLKRQLLNVEREEALASVKDLSACCVRLQLKVEQCEKMMERNDETGVRLQVEESEGTAREASFMQQQLDTAIKPMDEFELNWLHELKREKARADELKREKTRADEAYLEGVSHGRNGTAWAPNRQDKDLQVIIANLTLTLADNKATIAKLQHELGDSKVQDACSVRS